MHRDIEALALLSEEIVLRDPAVRKDQLIGRGTADTHLVFLGPEGKARGSLFYDKGGDFLHHSAALFNLAGNREDNVNIRFLTVCDKAL